MVTENHKFLGFGLKVASLDQTRNGKSRNVSKCARLSAVLGLLFMISGFLILSFGYEFVLNVIQKRLALTENSSTMESWLRPPVQAYFHIHVFNIKNPTAVLEGQKPIVEDKGPYVYR